MAITIKRPKLTLKRSDDADETAGASEAGFGAGPAGPGVELAGEPPKGTSYLFDVICGALAVACMLVLVLVQLSENSYY